MSLRLWAERFNSEDSYRDKSVEDTEVRGFLEEAQGSMQRRGFGVGKAEPKRVPQAGKHIEQRDAELEAISQEERQRRGQM